MYKYANNQEEKSIINLESNIDTNEISELARDI